MLAIEIDPLLIETLINREEFSGLKVINSDILLQDIESLSINSPVRVIGNIPYNITSSIIFWLIEQLHCWEDAFIMMQKEVAKRLTSNVGTKSYGRLTVVAGAYLDFEYCFTIPPDVFIPKPKVESAFVRFTKKKEPLISDKNYTRFNKLVASAFSQRRKMLRNTLKSWDIPPALQESINFDRRPETLTIEEFASLV
jgi:16S rRNA (adenine1518-N6/adenine1519-N6)-dimethyltransferase